MSGNQKDDSENRNPSLPPVEENQESIALEILIREETKRQLEAAWVAQRRLAQACFIEQTTKPIDQE
jgi:hypothetical protein